MKACKKGGKVEEHDYHEEKEDKKKIDTGEDGETPDEPLKKGGKVKKAHHAHGGAAKHRLDKRARGGKVTSPSHPLSGAAPTKMRSGFSEKQKIGKQND